MRMYNPPHPGEILQELWLDPMDISVTEAAHLLGVSRKTLSKIVNGHSALEPGNGYAVGAGIWNKCRVMVGPSGSL